MLKKCCCSVMYVFISSIFKIFSDHKFVKSSTRIKFCSKCTCTMYNPVHTLPYNHFFMNKPTA